MKQELLVGLIAGHTCKLLENLHHTHGSGVCGRDRCSVSRSALSDSELTQTADRAALPVVNYERSIRMRKLLV